MIINQSLINKLFHHGVEREFCPRFVKTHVIDHVKEFNSASIQKGYYFESLCIGSGADGHVVRDLPRKENGKKTVDQERIEEQVMRFEVLKNKYKMHVVPGGNTQIKVYKKFSDDIMLCGTMDIFPTIITTPLRQAYAIVDIKLTADIHKDFGMFSWNSAASIDPLQGYMYPELALNIDFVANREMGNDIQPLLEECGITHSMTRNIPAFFYWIFDYSPRTCFKIIEVQYNRDRQRELYEAIRKTAAIIRKFDDSGWEQTLPSYDNCSQCALMCENCFKPEPKFEVVIEPNAEFENIEYEII